MRQNRLAIAVLFLVGHATATYGQQDVEKLIEKRDPAIQAQIQRILDVFQKPGIDPHDVDVLREVQTLKKLTDDKDELVKQLAIFVATTESTEDMHLFIAGGILDLLDFPPRNPIRVLAPYLDTDNRQLRDFAGLWFVSHDKATTFFPGPPSIRPVNYADYLEYVRWTINHQEEVPAAFVKYIYERSPGRALLVFAYASQNVDLAARLQAIHKSIEARQKGEAPPDQQAWQARQEGIARGRARMAARRELELAEHIVSNAIWLKENEFAERFQAALPEAKEELAKLAKHDEWWARLYVAYIMRQHPELRQADFLQQLSADSHPLVREAAGPEVAQQKP